MEKDTIAALRAGWNGKVDGRVVVQSKVPWYLTKHLNENWEFADDHYHVVVRGDPGVEARIRFVAPKSWGNHDSETTTALSAVNAAFNVRAARPGILTLQDIGLVCAPVGIW